MGIMDYLGEPDFTCPDSELPTSSDVRIVNAVETTKSFLATASFVVILGGIAYLVKRNLELP